jgi:hypothetical protein
MSERAAASGIGTTDRTPWNMPPVYCVSILAPPGCGPLGLAALTSPLPFRTKKLEPSALNRTDVGYQPAGTQPCTTLAPGFSTLTTTTVLLSALATSIVVPSGERASPLGVEPTGALG